MTPPASTTHLLGVANRIAASLLGCWAFVWGFATLGITGLVAFGQSYDEARMAIMLLAFLVFLVAFCWTFAALIRWICSRCNQLQITSKWLYGLKNENIANNCLWIADPQSQYKLTSTVSANSNKLCQEWMRSKFTSNALRLNLIIAASR